MCQSFFFQTKSLMQESMKSGYLMLGKTRYSRGKNFVSKSQLPNEDKEVFAVAYCHSDEENIPNLKEDISFPNPQIIRRSTVLNIPVEEKEDLPSEEKTNNKDDQEVRLRGKKNSDESDKKDGEKETKKVDIDPIRWFSALPPQSLKDAQIHFQAALKLGVECVSLQRQLDALNEEYALCYETVSKLKLNEE